MKFRFILLIAVACVLSNCESIRGSKTASLTPDSHAITKTDTRAFSGIDEASLLSSATETLAEMGYRVEETETRIGLIMAQRHVEKQITKQIASKAFLKIYSEFEQLSDDPGQLKIIILTDKKEDQTVTLKVAFIGVYRDEEGVLVKQDRLKKAELYQDFFARLSKQTGLEAKEI